MSWGRGRRAALLLALLLGTACTGPSASEQPPAGPAESPPPPPVTLEVRVAKVTAAALKGRPDRGPLREPAEAIRRTITDLYLAGFLDPESRARGYGWVIDAFAPDVRGRARDDLRQLSLGRAGRSLDEVVTIRSRIVVEFLLDGRKRPVAATTDMEFSAMGYAGGLEVPIRHDADYVMEPFGKRWLITGYEVQGRIGP